MKITINKKNYTLSFGLGYAKYVMALKGYKKFSEFYKFIGKLSFKEEDFAPEHYDAYAEVVLLSINYTSKENTGHTVDEISEILFANMGLFTKVVEFIVQSQPQEEPVDPAMRKKQKVVSKK